ncbi:hypothetical protein Clacol_007710 [Clathrus columnatus]|uniref:AVL9/DENND6 domain-containing protein n=1 Tax=Clathrus columnatus TaxID=1419009 RepID=A0AAV5AFN7_9AGAM|nr:hypothetical protein Clacol_007710 [Clathrus columnatus]
MSSFGVLSESPVEDNDDHSHFFVESDDDADTASQKSIPLSSNPSSPRKLQFSDSTIRTPMKSTFSPRTNRLSDVPFENVTLSPTKENISPVKDHDTNSIPETGSGSPSVVTSFKFEEGGTRPSSMSSSTSFFGREEEALKIRTDLAQNVSPQMPPYLSDRSQSEADSVYSTKSGNSSTGGGKKARPESKLLETNEPIILGVALVDFNHIIGPRIEFFEGSVFEDEEVVRIIPFLALPDGAHISSEDYSYFHLVPSRAQPTTLFGISCNRQIASSELLAVGEDVTRSTVQKAVVILASKPVFGAIRQHMLTPSFSDKLGVVTNAFFNQRDFREVKILVDFYTTLENSVRSQLTESGLYMALLQTLDDCGSPPLAARAPTLTRPSSLKTSDRKSLLAFAGLPLDIFGKDSFFQPYLPLQQIDIAKGTNSWLCGCTNSMVYTQSDYDLLINIENNTFEFRDSRLERILALTPADRKWIDDIVKDVNEGWDDNDPTKPNGMQFKGSDDYLRTKFEEYISAALATIKYAGFLAKSSNSGVLISAGYDEVCQEDFGQAWISAFKTTNAYEVWDRITDPVLFDIIEPRHPCIDKPSAVTDIGLQISETFRDLRLEQQLAPTKEAISNAISAGSANVLKTVDGLKGRWNARRAASASRVGNSEERSAETAPSATAVPTSPPPMPSESSTPASQEKTQRPSSLTSEAKAALGSWGSGIGSFFSQKAARFSLSRNSSIISLPPPPTIRVESVPDPYVHDEVTPTVHTSTGVNIGHAPPQGEGDYVYEDDPAIEISHGIAS